MKILTKKTVPCIMADDLTEDQVKAFRLEGNRGRLLQYAQNSAIKEILVFQQHG